MIDRCSRDRLAKALRQYVSGLKTNDDLDDVEVDGRDRGAAAVKERSWCLYDDNCQHRAAGKHYLGKSERDEIARWIIYLHSDVEYIWPDYKFDRIVNWPMNLLTFGWWERNKARLFDEFKVAGDFSVWPFVCQREYEDALEHARYFSGRPA